ncbi:MULTISPECIES: DNA repair protein RecN [Psychrobacter]|jgi:DNA repair protein RecN (Recombination protein N)|uniref:DNA repair protein RecN n=3 Tax=Psychrobacter TaxID=497 RepID=A0A1G6XFA5_9GAMM|nr:MULTISPECIES: DNA repair protein RecN [Psychrobacter]MDH4903699.1 DNA repair protein RecN [Psychrobacter pocilloporae]GLR28179.1 DNA repair protein RecN [Psychrobacter pacificensis]SDD76850.1 DNA replication and repair protein RecN [Psychrobacter pacificensis]HBD03023.1 DNA repair protein RecN [Psychrobacter sp.]|tara:strand:+ start:5186 stop:6865 length:1680 start_codon:yes stop_codon:yes gene_type:complete
MLVSLTLHQFALIAQHELSVAEGFNVITGETGAGKSLLLDALSLCVGARADIAMVRHGADNADIYAQFDVHNNSVIAEWFAKNDRALDEPEVLIRRQLSNTGRSKAWLNGSPASLAELKSLGALLVNIHSQHAQQALLKPQFVVNWLDEMAQITPLTRQTASSYQQYQQLKRRADDIASREAQRQDRIQLLQSQLADITPLLAVDYAEVESEHEELSNIEALMQEASHGLHLLDNDTDEPDVMTLLGQVIKLCDHQVGVSQTFEQASEQLHLAQQQITEVTALLSDYAEQQLPDPERLQALDNLISLSHRLSRKYNLPASDLIDEAKAWQKQLEQLENEPSSDAMAAQIEQAWQDYLALATQLNQERTKAAPTISKQLIEQLQPLALPNARCEFVFTKKTEPSQYNAHGCYDIDLLFSANVGMPMQPLHKIASGGELSRMALVMQVLQATNADNKAAKPMLVFDEVDVGISGGTAQVVGELLRALGQTQQLLAITHQAQVAAQAHQHILVQKHHQEQTESELIILTDSAQVDELARMSGGVTITDVTRDHARSLLSDVK